MIKLESSSGDGKKSNGAFLSIQKGVNKQEEAVCQGKKWLFADREQMFF